MHKYILWFVVGFCWACEKGPESIQYGKDQCAYCKMTIADPRFGAEIVTEKGRIYKYDAIECMIHFLKEDQQELPHILVTPYDHPTQLKNEDSLFFVFSNKIKSPMGANLAAFENKNALDSLIGNDVSVYTWEQVYAKLEK